MKKYIIMGIVICWIIGVIRLVTPTSTDYSLADQWDMPKKVAPPIMVTMATPPPSPKPSQSPVFVAYADTPGEEPIIDNIIPSRSVSAIDYARKDVVLLATLIFGEAGNQSFDGKLAVGTVVMNRMIADKSWMGGHTLKGVIYAKGQFDAVRPDWHKPDTDSILAAETILLGHRSFEEDILYFFNPRASTDLEFINSIDVVYVIQDHVFGRDPAP